MIQLTNIVIDHIDNENATSAADLKVCLVVNTITQEWGNEIGWTVGCEWKQHGCNVDDCKSNGDYEDFTNYTQEKRLILCRQILIIHVAVIKPYSIWTANE